MQSYDRSDFYRSNRDYGNLLGDGTDGIIEEEEEGEEEQDVRPRGSGNKSREDAVSAERQEYLQRRQKLKELERQKLKAKFSFADSTLNGRSNNEPPSAGNRSRGDTYFQERKRHLPYDNYGSFFGPSEPVVARRIIEEARAKEEAESLATIKVAKKAPEPKIVHSSGAFRSLSNSFPSEKPPPRVVDEATVRIQRLKEARDYSCLFSDEDPSDSVPESKPTPAANQDKERSKPNVSQNKKDAVSTRKGTLLPKPVSSVADAKQKLSRLQVSKASLSSNKQSQSIIKPSKMTVSTPGSKPPLMSGPGRPSQTGGSVNGNPANVKKLVIQPANSSKAVTPQSISNVNKVRTDHHTGASSSGKITKVSAPYKSASLSSTEKKRPPVSQVEQRRAASIGHAEQRRPASIGHAEQRRPASIGHAEQRRPAQATGPSKLLSRSKPIKAQGNSSEFRRDRRRARESDSEDSFLDDDEEDTGNVSSMIQKLFRYNPNKYRDIDDEDDRNMEVSFSRIQAEERRSARIAKEEDERELALIEAEERAERVRKESKRRKLK